MASDSRTVLAQLDARVPAAEVDAVAAWVAAGSRETVPARPAASVLLLRVAPTAPDGIEVYVQHRQHTMAFAAGHVTFPGGRQETVDPDLRACAVRELAEETGVVLDPAALLDWAHWITPQHHRLRYDTRFFVAVLPEGQQARNTTSEAIRSHWTTPATALAQADAGRWALMPPTRSLLLELAAADSLSAVLARAVDRTVHPVLAVPRLDPTTGWVWDYPGDPPPTAAPGSADGPATLLRADNPGPMTLTGTNTWLLAGDAGIVVVDPGPALPDHRDAILAAGPVELVVLTHRHRDHSELADELTERTGAPVRAADRALCRGAAPLTDGARLPGGLQVVATPGHTDDSICLLHDEGRVILTGDTVLGVGSSVILYGDGSVAASLASLQRLADLSQSHRVRNLLPGHGPAVPDPVARLEHDLAHRQDRIDQVGRAVRDGVAGVAAVTDRVHAGLDPRLREAARSSIAAHLDHLGALAADDPWVVGLSR